MKTFYREVNATVVPGTPSAALEIRFDSNDEEFIVGVGLSAGDDSDADRRAISFNIRANQTEYIGSDGISDVPVNLATITSQNNHIAPIRRTAKRGDRYYVTFQNNDPLGATIDCRATLICEVQQ